MKKFKNLESQKLQVFFFIQGDLTQSRNWIKKINKLQKFEILLLKIG